MMQVVLKEELDRNVWSLANLIWKAPMTARKLQFVIKMVARVLQDFRKTLVLNVSITCNIIGAIYLFILCNNFVHI